MAVWRKSFPLGVATIGTLLGVASASAERIVFPADSGVIDVTLPPYGAVPDDGRDDTAAIQQALRDHPTGNHLFFFPSGTYDITDALLRLPEGHPDRNEYACLELAGSKKRNILQGASRDSVVLRLADSVPADFDRAVLNFGQRPAQRFRNALRNLTVSVGRGHARAVAVQFNASNQGVVSDVRIVSEDPQLTGAIGLDLRHTDEIGPCLIRRLEVVGFDYGIRSAFQTASQTFEDIRLERQRVAGWQNGFSQSVFVHRLESLNAGPALINASGGPGDPGEAKALVADAVLRHLPDADPPGPALRNQKVMVLRDVRIEGYAHIVSRELTYYRGNAGPPGDRLDEYWANGWGERRRGGAFRLFPSPDRMLRLPIADAPRIPWDEDLSHWRGPHHYQTGEPGSGSGYPDDAGDDTAALQAAIDSGATTVYLPNGTWRIAGPLFVRGNVRRLLGCEARLSPTEGTRRALVRVEDGSAPAVVIERLEAGGIRFEQATGRPLVLANLLGGSYATPAGQDPSHLGPLFLEDVVFSPCTFRGQQVWCRQLDIEGSQEQDDAIAAKVVNTGGKLWVLGLKTEDAGTVVRTTDGGATEVLGALHVGGAGDEPRYVTRDAAFCVACSQGGGGFGFQAEETRNGETRRAKDFDQADVYVAYPAETIARDCLLLDSEDEGVEIVGNWRESDRHFGGFLGKSFLHDDAKAKQEAYVTFRPTVRVAGRYRVSLRWPASVSGFGQAESVPVTIRHANGDARVTVDQSQGGNGWHELGTFDLAAGPAAINVSNRGTTGHVVVDAVRLVRVAP